MLDTTALPTLGMKGLRFRIVENHRLTQGNTAIKCHIQALNPSEYDSRPPWLTVINIKLEGTREYMEEEGERGERGKGEGRRKNKLYKTTISWCAVTNNGVSIKEKHN